MTKYIITTLIILSSTIMTFAQSDTAFLRRKIEILNGQVVSLKNSNATLNKRLEDINSTLRHKSDSLQIQVSQNTANIELTANKLGIKIDQTATNTSKKIDDLDSLITKNSLYWIVGFLITALLFGTIYFFLRKKITEGNSALDKQIIATKKSLEEEGIKLDTKLTEVLETQLKISNAERRTVAIDETDHSLALKVADEIVRIQKNLSNMDPDTKGLKQLAASVKRIQDNFEANGYEMVDLLGRPFDARIKVDAQFRPDDTLDKGQEIISRIIKPQVLYKGIMIQAGLVEVSQG